MADIKIKLNRNVEDRILPKDFFEVLFHQYFPILSMTYVASIIGMAFYQGGSFSGAADEILNQTSVYSMALWMALWVSIPGFLWICIKGMIRFHAYAGLWYKIISALMSVTLLFSLFLFPEDEGGLREFIIFVLPIHIFMYTYLCVFKLNQWIAQPFQILACALLIYGFIV